MFLLDSVPHFDVAVVYIRLMLGKFAEHCQCLSNDSSMSSLPYFVQKSEEGVERHPVRVPGGEGHLRRGCVRAGSGGVGGRPRPGGDSGQPGQNHPAPRPRTEPHF